MHQAILAIKAAPYGTFRACRYGARPASGRVTGGHIASEAVERVIIGGEPIEKVLREQADKMRELL